MSSVVLRIAGTVSDMDTLAARVRWAVEQSPLSARKAGLNAGLSSAYVSQMVAGKNTNPGWDSIRALAKVLEVDPHWLSTGEGAPPTATPAMVPAVDPYSSRPPFLALLRGRGVDERFITALQGYRFKDGDPGLDGWHALYKELVEVDGKLAGDEHPMFDEVGDV